MYKPLTIEEGYVIQSQQLHEWSKLLKQEIYDLLVKEVEYLTKMKPIHDGYDVPRGIDIDQALFEIKARLITS